MKKLLSLTLAAVMALGLLAGCSGSKNDSSNDNGTSSSKTPEELVALYTDAINNCGSEMVEYNPVVSEFKEEDGTSFLLELLGLSTEDFTAAAVSLSQMNTQAYTIAAFMPAADKAETILEALQTYHTNQQAAFERYLEDQYEIACAARLETLSDGTIFFVMTEGQDAAFDSIKETIENA